MAYIQDTNAATDIERHIEVKPMQMTRLLDSEIQELKNAASSSRLDSDFENGESFGDRKQTKKNNLLYQIEEYPPWHITVLYALQVS